MIFLILQFLFPLLVIVVPMLLYKSTRPAMTKFYTRMLSSENVRKFYTHQLLILLLLFHFLYVSGHFGEWGVLLSTILSAVLFSHKRADQWLRFLHRDNKHFGIAVVITLAIGFIPHLYTMAVTLALLLLAGMFYPSRQAVSSWPSEKWRLMQFPKELAKFYYGIVTSGDHIKWTVAELSASTIIQELKTQSHDKQTTTHRCHSDKSGGL